MPVKILFIGNSHTKSFKDGWDAMSESKPNVSATFLGVGTKLIDDFYVDAKNQALCHDDDYVRKKSEGWCEKSGAIKADQFDFCVITGAFLWWKGIDQRFFSSQATEVALNCFIENTLSFKLLGKIRRITDAKVFITHAPFPASRQHDTGGHANRYEREIEKLNQEILKNTNAELLIQPRETYGSTLQTNLEFAVGKRTTSRPDEDSRDGKLVVDDMGHMNSDFGNIYLAQLLKKIAI